MKIRYAIIVAALLFSPTLFGQTRELSVLAGVTNHSTEVGVLDTVSISGGNTAAVQVDFAALLKETRSGKLYLELPAARVLKASVGIRADEVTAGTSQFFFTPGVRYQFTPASRVAPYVAAGFGFGWFDGANVVASPPIAVRVTDGFQPAAGFGGGAEFRIHRGFTFRAEVRDFVAAGAHTTPRNHVVFQGGFGVHF